MSTTVRSGRSDMLRSERVAGGMLPRVLGSSDMVAIFVAIVLLVTSSATIQAAGPAAFVATLSGSQTPLVSNTAGSIMVLGATVSYGLWFYLVAGITVASLAVGVVLYLIGRRTEARTVELDHGRAAA